MICFPQMNQFPIVRSRRIRTAKNELPDGSMLCTVDLAGSRVEWDLHFRSLQDSEVDRLSAFFEAMEGTLGRFVFLDPCGNLLCWSEDLERAEWEHSTLLTLTSGNSDPLGSDRAWAVQNPTAAELDLKQTVNAPAAYQYNFSVWARSATNCTVRLSCGEQATQHIVDANWRRISAACLVANAEGESVAFGITLPPSSRVELFGLQASSQQGPSAYAPTESRGAIWPSASFAQDRLDLK